MLKFLWLCKNTMKNLSLKVSIAIRMYTVDTGTYIYEELASIHIFMR